MEIVIKTMDDLYNFYDKYFDYLTTEELQHIFYKCIGKICFFKEDITKQEVLDFMNEYVRIHNKIEIPLFV